MPTANPSGMGGGYGQHQGGLGAVKEEPVHALFRGAQEGNGDSYAGHGTHHRQDNSSGSSDQSTSTDLINGRGHSVNGRPSINQHQTGGQHQMRVFEAGLQRLDYFIEIARQIDGALSFTGLVYSHLLETGDEFRCAV